MAEKTGEVFRGHSVFDILYVLYLKTTLEIESDLRLLNAVPNKQRGRGREKGGGGGEGKREKKRKKRSYSRG